MKKQYLGDSKDSFKWDYHDYLASKLGYPRLTLLLMMTPDDGGGDGRTPPERFPASPAIISFCHNLREERNIQLLRGLPNATGASYIVDLHNPDMPFTNTDRKAYFSIPATNEKQLIFLDPDNGFEPKAAKNEKHVLYSDIAAVINQMSEKSLISVFQHFRRVPFARDFACIKERLGVNHLAAISWHSLMFVTIAKSRETIEAVIVANQHYSELRPVVKALQ